MSNHASKNDDDASHSSESEDEAGNTVGKEHQLRKNNPHSIENDVKIYDARTAVKIKKKPKLLSRAPPPPQDDYAELQKQPNIDSHADGGFINPDNAKPRDRRMKWDADADRKLLIFGFGRDINSKEYQIIADGYKEKPTQKAIQERITKLRVETRRALKETGIFDPGAVVKKPPPPAVGGLTPRGSATPGLGVSSPVMASAKKAAPLEKATPAKTTAPAKKRGRPTSTPKTPAFTPRTGTPASRPQPPSVHLPQGPQSFHPPQSQAPQVGQQGQPSVPPPPTFPAPPGWASRHGGPGAGVANMSWRPTGSLQAAHPQMGVPPLGAPALPPHSGQYGALPPNPFTGPQDLRMGQFQQQQQPALPVFAPGLLGPTPHVQQFNGTPFGAQVSNVVGAAEGEAEDLMARSERELQAKQAKRDARKRDLHPRK